MDTDVASLEGEECKSPTNTLNLTKTKWGFLLTVQVGVLETKDTFEVVGILDDQGTHFVFI